MNFRDIAEAYDTLRRYPPVVLELDADALPMNSHEGFELQAGKVIALPPGYHMRLLEIPSPWDTWLVDERLFEYTGGS